MVEENEYLKKEKIVDPADLRKSGISLYISGKLGQYAALMYGFYSVMQESPDIRKVVLGGFAYGVFSFLEYTSNLLGFKAEGESIRQEQTKMGEKLGILENKIKLQIAGGLSRKSSGERDKLDMLVDEELKKEGVDLGKDTHKKAREDVSKKLPPQTG